MIAVAIPLLSFALVEPSAAQAVQDLAAIPPAVVVVDGESRRPSLYPPDDPEGPDDEGAGEGEGSGGSSGGSGGAV